jgi:hypothetical protein
MSNLTQEEIARLVTTEGYLSNFHLKLIKSDLNPETQKSLLSPDLILDTVFENSKFSFVVQILRSSRPKEFFKGIMQVLTMSRNMQSNPMVVLPFLSEELSEIAFKNGISSVDLCGNGLIYIPGRILVSKSGKKNLYPDSRLIKNIYRGDSSIVARLFLGIPRVKSVNQVHNLICTVGGATALSTVSKVIAELEKDLIVGRHKRELELLQPNKLLENLEKNYRAPLVRKTFIGRYAGVTRDTLEKLGTAAKLHDARITLTGYSSTLEFAVMAQEEMISLYTDAALDLILADTELEETDRFANIQISQIADNFPFFGAFARPSDFPVATASPVQAYLELCQGDKRQKEVASQIKAKILQNTVDSRIDRDE